MRTLTSLKKALLTSANSSSKHPPNTEVSAYTRNRLINSIVVPHVVARSVNVTW